MQISRAEYVEADPSLVWQVFTNPEMLMKCTPGCEQMTKVGADTYQATFTMGVGGIKGHYAGTMALADQIPNQAYCLSIAMEGKTGFVRGQGQFEFEPVRTGTGIRMNWDVSVGGLVASVGQRVLGSVAKMVTDQFFRNLAKQLAPTE